jgi:hypothetical protein
LPPSGPKPGASTNFATRAVPNKTGVRCIGQRNSGLIDLTARLKSVNFLF